MFSYTLWSALGPLYLGGWYWGAKFMVWLELEGEHKPSRCRRAEAARLGLLAGWAWPLFLFVGLVVALIMLVGWTAKLSWRAAKAVSRAAPAVPLLTGLFWRIADTGWHPSDLRETADAREIPR
jgi:hypothetical protein